MLKRLRKGALLKSSSWLIGSIIVGQLQLWVVWFRSSGTIISTDDLTYNKVLLDGYILFFCTGITTSLGLDYWFNNKFVTKRESLIYFLGPFVILTFALLIGSSFIGQDPKEIKMNFIRWMHSFLIAITTLYILLLKANEFSKP